MKIRYITIHCSDSDFGSRHLIDRWHRERGFKEIGYHYVILNGWIEKGRYIPALDGSIEIGRYFVPKAEMLEHEVGAHVKGYNRGNIGICLIGKGNYTEMQYISLAEILKSLIDNSGLTPQDIKGHNFFNSSKACPCFDWQKFITDTFYGG